MINKLNTDHKEKIINKLPDPKYNEENEVVYQRDNRRKKDVSLFKKQIA